MRVVGLTGGIACGKSTVTRLLLQRDIPVIDCDSIARDVVRKVRRAGRRAVAGRQLVPPVLLSRGAGRAAAGQVGLEARGQRVRGGRALGDRWAGCRPSQMLVACRRASPSAGASLPACLPQASWTGQSWAASSSPTPRPGGGSMPRRTCPCSSRSSGPSRGAGSRSSSSWWACSAGSCGRGPGAGAAANRQGRAPCCAVKPHALRRHRAPCPARRPEGCPGRPPQVIDMPLLFETGFGRWSRPNVVVACDPEVQVGAGLCLRLPAASASRSHVPGALRSAGRGCRCS
jgi:hypothetical protein